MNNPKCSIGWQTGRRMFFILFGNLRKEKKREVENILQPVCHPIEHFGLFIGNNIRIVSVSILSMYECFLLISIVIVQRFLIPCFIFPYLPSSTLFLPPSILTYIDTYLPIFLIRISLTDISRPSCRVNCWSWNSMAMSPDCPVACFSAWRRANRTLLYGYGQSRRHR